MINKKASEIIDRIVARIGSAEIVLLESQHKSHPSSQKSFIATKPKRIIEGIGSQITITEKGESRQFDADPWKAISEFQQSGKNWMFGYFGYDLKNSTENLQSKNEQLIEVPDFYFMEPEILYSVEGSEVTSMLGADDRKKSFNSITPGRLKNLTPLIHKSEYLENVDIIKQQIKEGDYYELNYSYPFMADYEGDSYWLYQKMREINPVPFGGFIQRSDLSVSCTSPERFLKRIGNRIFSEPIKGTAARSSNNDEDDYQKSLLLNEKNRAENLMIVDLVRHDLSKIAKKGSVNVPKLFDVQSFGTVHQLISTVEAEVSEDVLPIDIIKACFPMGSMTGAPKIEVMKAIDSLEIYRRNIYSGAIGYIDPDGNFDFNVVIRSAIIKNGKLVYPVGGAITSDSDPEDEWSETHLKAKVLTKIFDEYNSEAK